MLTETICFKLKVLVVAYPGLPKLIFVVGVYQNDSGMQVLALCDGEMRTLSLKFFTDEYAAFYESFLSEKKP
jgi:hypothetical protein